MKEKLSMDLKRQPIFQITNIAYKQIPAWFEMTKRNLEFSLLKPAHIINQKLPLVLWLCGGSWKMIDKGVLLPEMKYLADAGYIVASIDYRMSNEGEFPSQVEDVKAAIRYLKKHADEYGIDKDRVAIMGASAGGHLSLISAYSHNTDIFDVGDNLDESSYVKAVVDFYAPTNFEVSSIEGENKFFFLDLINFVGSSDFKDEKFKKVSPISYVGPDSQPTLILHGNEDDLVPVSQAHTLYNKLKKFNIDTQFIELEGAGHGSDHFYQSEINEKVLKFLDKYL